MSRQFRHCAVAIVVAFACGALPAWAVTTAPTGDRDPLWDVYYVRPDLQKLFRPDDGTSLKSPKTVGLDDLEDWAREFGWREYPEQLKDYAPKPSGGTAVVAPPSAKGPTRSTKATFNFAKLTADAVLVIDEASGETLLAHNAKRSWPIASLTKLMTAMIVLDNRVSFDRHATIEQADSVGGAQLRVARGVPMTVRDLFNAMIVGSANDAAHALSRQCGLDAAGFVTAMNAKARDLGLTATTFVEPTGLDLGNVSTAEEIAVLLRSALRNYYDIRKSASTARYDIILTEEEHHRLSNTNQLLTDERNGLVVLGGKTGYLNESGWNLAVKMQDYRRKPVTVVIFGAANKTRLFNEAATAAKWTWANYRWGK